MPVAACRLTGSVSGFHDPSLVSVMVHVTPDSAPSCPQDSRTLALHGAGTHVLGPMDGAHERATRQSCDQLPVQFADWVCGAQALLRADRPSHAHQPGARRPGRSRSGRAFGVANGLPAHDVPVAGRELHATRGAREGATGGGHRAFGVTPPRLPVGHANFGPRTPTGRPGGSEAEAWRRRGDRA